MAITETKSSFSYAATRILRSVLPAKVRRGLTLGRDQFGVMRWGSSVLDRSAQDPGHDFDAELAL